MPWASIEAAKKAGAKTELGGASLSLTQINKMAEMADAMKAEGKVDNPWAVAISNFQKTHKIENGHWVLKESAILNQNIHETISLSEGQILPDEEGGKKSYKAWWPLLKEGPGNKVAKNYYSKKALESVIPWISRRNKMYLAHAEGEVKPQERNPRDWVGSIRDSKIENGVLFGLVQAVDPWLREKYYECPQDLAASIEARGRMNGTIQHEGEPWNLIEEVKYLGGFMIVDYPGNAPMGVQLAEADVEDDPPQEEKMENVAELKEKVPELYNQIVKETQEADKVEWEKKLAEKDTEIKAAKEKKSMEDKEIKEQFDALKNKMDAMEVLNARKARKDRIEEMVKDLPKEAITPVFKELLEEAKDEEAIKKIIEDRAKLFEGKVLGHGKVEPVDAAKALKEREAEVLHSMGQKTAEEIEAAKKK